MLGLRTASYCTENEGTPAGESGSKLNELQPDLYPAKVVQAGKTREQVKEELAQAIHTGDLMAAGEDAPMARSNSPTLGHPKFPQAGRPDYDDSGVMAMRAAASLRR